MATSGLRTDVAERDDVSGTDYNTVDCEHVQRVMRLECFAADNFQSDFRPIKFVTPFLPDAYRLLEVTEDVLQEMQSGTTFYIRGDWTDAAHLCTSDRSYCMMDTHISGSYALLAKSPFPSDSSDESSTEAPENEVVFLTSNILKLCPSSVNVEGRLYKLLSSNSFEGKPEEPSVPKTTIETLIQEIPASEAEIQRCLANMFCCEIDGGIRLISYNCVEKITSDVVQFVEENSWPWTAVDEELTIVELSTLYSSVLLRRWFQLYTEASEHKQSTTRRVRQASVCRLYAESILRRAHKFQLDDFMAIWQHSVPEGMQIDLQQLYGVAVVHTDPAAPCVQYFPLSHLPDAFHDRLNAMFDVKDRWTYAEMEPYLKDLIADPSALRQKIEKSCRVKCTDGVLTYSAKG